MVSGGSTASAAARYQVVAARLADAVLPQDNVGSVPVAEDPCPDVEVVFARGTGEAPGLASVGTPFIAALTADLPGKTVSSYAVSFQTDYAQASTIVGANDMENHVKTMAAQCPDTGFVLGGYSQGAAVVDLTLGLGPVLAPIYITAGLTLGPGPRPRRRSHLPGPDRRPARSAGLARRADRRRRDLRQPDSLGKPVHRHG